MNANPCRSRMLAVAALAAVVTLGGLWPAATVRAADPEATDTALFLMRRATIVRQDGQHHALLRSLRHLEDPDLRPLFEFLARSHQPMLRIHGILGLAEISRDRRVDLKLVAELDDAPLQAELVTAAMDSKLMDLEQTRTLVDWPGLDIAVRILLGAHLVAAGEAPPPALLDEAMEADNLGRRSLASLLLLQRGDARGLQGLQALDNSDDPRRDNVRMMVLETILRHQIDQAGPWALQMAQEPDVNSRLAMVALRVAMRFGAPGAEQLWRQLYDSNPDVAHRTRLALVALRMSPWMKAPFYDALLASDDPLIRQMGQAGRAVASEQRIADACVGLVQMHNALANAWAFDYALSHAPPTEAKMILLALILAYEQGPANLRVRLLDDAVSAAEAMAEKFPEDAAKLLQPILRAAETDANLVQGILLGLVRAREGDPYRIVENLPPFDHPNANGLVLLMRAKSDRPLDAPQLNDLALLVRGGGRLQDSLRIQAAWIYLKRTNQARTALADILR